MNARAVTKARTVRVACSLGLAAALVATPVATANEANGSASCMGIERSAISPPGSSEEVAGGSAAFNAEVKAIADFLGLRPGGLFSFIARLREGSHDDCDAALG